jgi:hypothetical protein
MTKNGEKVYKRTEQGEIKKGEREKSIPFHFVPGSPKNLFAPSLLRSEEGRRTLIYLCTSFLSNFLPYSHE